MKVKSLIILSFMFVFSSVAFCIHKPEQNVYGVFSETFSGAVIDAPSGNENAVKVNLWQWNCFNLITVTSETVTDMIEGNKYWKIVNGEGNYGAIGVDVKNNDNKLNMSEYACIKFLVKSTCTSMGNLKIGIGINNNVSYKRLSELEPSFADGSWHEVTLDLSEYDLSNITSVLYLSLGGSSEPQNYIPGDSIEFDNIRWEKKNAYTGLSLSLLNIETDAPADKEKTFSFDVDIDSDLQETTWKIADEYIKMDFNGLKFKDNSYEACRIKIYTDNTSETANPKYTGSIGKDFPMGLINVSSTMEARSLCWRVSDSKIDKANLKIYKMDGPDGEPHFSDNKDTLGYNYSWLQDKKGYTYKDTYSVIWQNSSDLSARSAAAFTEATFSPAQFPLYLYLGADFSNVNSGDVYSTNTITIELFYE